MQLPETIQSLRCSHWAGDESAAERLHTLIDSDLAIITRRALRASSANSRLTREVRVMNRAAGPVESETRDQKVARVSRAICDRLLGRPLDAADRARRPETLHPHLGATQFS